jgi:small neutral amino acid transporter SnatA (MarC family)
MKQKSKVKTLFYRVLFILLLILIFLLFAEQHKQMLIIKAHNEDLHKQVHNLSNELKDLRNYSESITLYYESRLDKLESNTVEPITYQPKVTEVHKETEEEKSFQLQSIPETTILTTLAVFGGHIIKFLKSPLTVY